MAVSSTELILDRAHDAVVSMDEVGLVTYWNPAAESAFGRPRAEAVGRPVADLIIPERFRAAHVEGLRRFLADGSGPILDRRIEMTALRADGVEFPVQMTISALPDGDRWSFHASIVDLRELREAELERERLVAELRRALRGSERRFDAIVGSLSDPVTIRDREHRIVYANRAALAQLGFATVEELRDSPPASIMADYQVWGDDGREIAMDEIPSVRLLRGEPSVPLMIRTVSRHTGAQRWSLLKAAPLVDEAGEVEATITLIEDVTAQKRSELRGQFLIQAGEVLASSLDYEQTLRNVAELAVPDIADWCAVDLLDEDGDRRSVAVAHIDPQRLSIAERLRDYEPDRLDPQQGLGRAILTGEALLYGEISDEMLVQGAADDEHLELLRAVGFRSALIVPMRLGERILGALTLVSADSGRVLDRSDLELAEQVAARAAVAIENSRLYSQRSSVARTLQQSLLPEQLPEIPGYELASLYLPAMESSVVGGDFYDVWRAEDSWFIIVGDVTGKGVQAAALTSLVRHTVRTASEFLSSPAQLLARVDSTLKQRPTLSVCTALCMRLDGDHVTLAVGGHPLPLLITREGVKQQGKHGPLLGAFAGATWQDLTVVLKSGSTVVAYTDGVTDARGRAGERFGLPRLLDTLGGLDGRSVHDVIKGLTRSVGDFQTGAQADDTAAIALRRLPPDRAA